MQMQEFSISCASLSCPVAVIHASCFFSALQRPISGNPSDITVTEGQDVDFNCSFDTGTVLPLPAAVTWKFVSHATNHSRDLNETGTGTDRTSKLQLTAVNLSYGGTYECVIRNEFGELKSSQATLTVIKNMFVTTTPSQVTTPSQATTLSQAGPTVLNTGAFKVSLCI